MNAARVVCRSLWKKYGEVVAAAAVSIDLHAGEIVGVIGPNGSGKSTLINLLSGFVAADSGTMFLNGAEISRWSPARRVKHGIARTFQDARLASSLSGEENVALANPKSHGTRIVSLTDELIELFELGPVAHDRASHFSFGQRKLFSVVCALATGAQNILLDEPFAGLSPTMAVRLCEQLGRLRSLGSSFLMVDHNFSYMSQAADRVLVMNAGAIIANAPPTTVLSLPSVREAYIGR